MIETRLVEGLPPATETNAEVAAARTNAEEPAFEALYRTHARRIYSLAYRFTGNAADAEELLQDIFLQAYRRLDSFRREAALSTWLHRLAVNRCLDHLRSRAARQDARTGSLADAARPQPRARTSSPITRLDLERAIAQLPDRCRAAFVLHDVEGYEHREIAALFGIVRRRVAAEGRAPRVAAGWWSRWSFGGAGSIRAAGLWRWSVGGTALAAAAGIVLAIVLAGGPDPMRSPASDTPGGTVRPAPIGGLGPFEPAYVSAIRDLEQLAGARAPVHPAVQAFLAGDLAVVERAIAESRSAVESAPGSAVARDRLRAGLARKLALLRTSAALGLEPRGRGDPRP